MRGSTAPQRLRRLARRLAGPERWGANALRIPWEAVVEVGPERIVVRS